MNTYIYTYIYTPCECLPYVCLIFGVEWHCTKQDQVYTFTQTCINKYTYTCTDCECVCLCLMERDKEIARDKVGAREGVCVWVCERGCVCVGKWRSDCEQVSVCVRVREKQRACVCVRENDERERVCVTWVRKCLVVCARVCVCERERHREQACVWICVWVRYSACESVWVCRCVSVWVWVCECVSVWVCECVSERVCKYVGAWVRECVSL